MLRMQRAKRDYNLFYYPIKSLVLRMEWDLQMFGLILEKGMSNFSPLRHNFKSVKIKIAFNIFLAV